MLSASQGLAPNEGLMVLVLKLGRTRPLTEPHGGLQAGRTGYPQVQDADSSPWAQGMLGLGFQAKPKGKCGATRALTACGLDDVWQLMGRGRLRFPTLPRQLLNLTIECCMQKGPSLLEIMGGRRFTFS